MVVKDHGVDIRHKQRPLQFKRGTSKAFKRLNPVLLFGEPAFEKDTNKVKIGNGRNCYNDLPYIGDHSKPINGKSAYELWLEAGNEGTIDQFLDGLMGDPGQSAYEAWLSVGNEGTIVDFLDSLIGDSAYEIWLKEGHEGTIDEYLKSLKAKTDYEMWLDLGYEGTEEDYFDWLRTTTWGTLDEV